jgi:hypothetical protein
MAQWGPPQSVSGYGRYYGSHGESEAALLDLSDGMQHSRSEDVIAVGTRRAMAWLLAGTMPARFIGRTCRHIDR